MVETTGNERQARLKLEWSVIESPSIAEATIVRFQSRIVTLAWCCAPIFMRCWKQLSSSRNKEWTDLFRTRLDSLWKSQKWTHRNAIHEPRRAASVLSIHYDLGWHTLLVDRNEKYACSNVVHDKACMRLCAFWRRRVYCQVQHTFY